MNLIEWIIIGALVVVGLAVTLVILSFFTTWLKALLAKAPVGFPTLLAMRLRGVPVGLIVDARVTAVKASLPLTTDQLEAHYLAEGNAVQTVQALIAASKANIELSWDRAMGHRFGYTGNKQVGFGGRSHLHQSEDHRLHDRRQETIDGVAKDGIQVKVRARVTVRSNLDRYAEATRKKPLSPGSGKASFPPLAPPRITRWC